MKVNLLQMTPDPIDTMFVAAKTCYSEDTPLTLWQNRNGNIPHLTESIYNAGQLRMWKLVRKVLASGHMSIAEHACFTFCISDISRACSHQLVRHRHCTFSQQSQRYVEIKENFEVLKDLLYNLEHTEDFTESECAELEAKAKEIANKYFVDVDDLNYFGYDMALFYYLKAIKDGKKPEDARNHLPNATKTNLVITLNYAELIHICGLRMCTRAQREIRQLANLLAQNVIASGYSGEIMASLLRPKCELNGYCDEEKSCGKCKIQRITYADNSVAFKEIK